MNSVDKYKNIALQNFINQERKIEIFKRAFQMT